MIAFPARFRDMASDELHAYCATAAAILLHERETHYPRAVESRKMTQQASADGLELMRCILAQWRWVIDPARLPLPVMQNDGSRFGVPSATMLAELQKVAGRARERADLVAGEWAGLPTWELCCEMKLRQYHNDDTAVRLRDAWAKREMADLCEALAWYQHGRGDPRIVRYQYERGEVLAA